MRIATVAALLGALIPGATLLYGFAVGDFAGEGAQLLRMPRGIASFIDVYFMFTLFPCWIICRERSIVRSVRWVLSTMILGNFMASLCTPLALQDSDEDSKRFWVGGGWDDQAA